MEPYQRETIVYPWDNLVHFGDDTNMIIPPTGDIVHQILLRLVTPLTILGTNFIHFTELRLGSVLIERHYGETMRILNELIVPQGKQQGLRNLIGPGVNEYYILLPFQFKIPLCALNDTVTLRVVLEPQSGYVDPIDIRLVVDYVFLSIPERVYFQSEPLQYLTRVFQKLEFTISPGATDLSVRTQFDNCVKELFWIVQDPATGDYRNDVLTFQLNLNSVEFLSPNVANGLYLRNIHPLEHHTRVPTMNVYSYSFAFEPEKDQPTGEVDMSNISNQIHNLTLVPFGGSRVLRIYADSYNVATVQNGGITMLRSTLGAGFKN